MNNIPHASNHKITYFFYRWVLMEILLQEKTKGLQVNLFFTDIENHLS